MGIDGKTRLERDTDAYIDGSDGGIDRRVKDLDGNAKLAAILAAIGGGGIDTTPVVTNVSLGAINTEQLFVLPSNTKRFILKTRGSAVLKLSYTLGESGTDFITINKNAVYEDSEFYAAQTIYFQSPVNGDVVEIITYT